MGDGVSDFMAKLAEKGITVTARERYVCEPCQDSGWVLVDDGIEDGKRVRSATSKRCEASVHHRPKEIVRERTGEVFE